MAGTMSEADLVADLKISLQDSAASFSDAADGAFKRHLRAAADALIQFRPLVREATLTLVVGQPAYALPADFGSYVCDSYGEVPSARLNPWEEGYSGTLPSGRVYRSGAVPMLLLTPVPTSRHVAECGYSYPIRYLARHVIGAADADTTIAAADRALLLLRAQAEAMRELAVRNMTKPVQMRDGLTGVTRNSTPAALWQALLEQFEKAAS